MSETGHKSHEIFEEIQFLSSMKLTDSPHYS